MPTIPHQVHFLSLLHTDIISNGQPSGILHFPIFTDFIPYLTFSVFMFNYSFTLVKFQHFIFCFFFLILFMLSPQKWRLTDKWKNPANKLNWMSSTLRISLRTFVFIPLTCIRSTLKYYITRDSFWPQLVTDNDVNIFHGIFSFLFYCRERNCNALQCW